MQESLLARLTESGVGIVSHSILVLFARRERSWFNPLINTELNVTQVESISEGRPEFSSKKSEEDFNKQFHQIFVCKPEFCSNQQALEKP